MFAPTALKTTLLAATFSIFAHAPAISETLADPTGTVVLTVSGKVTRVNDADTARLDLAQLEAIERVSVQTSTIWTEGVQTFEGVSLQALVTHLGLEGTTLRATAINDYAVDIPLSDAVEGGAIVAYRLNGETMSLRDKGPLWVIYPYDKDADFRTEVIYSRSIWQLDRIEALD